MIRIQKRRQSAFSLVEVLVAMAILMVLVVMLLSITSSVQGIWSKSRDRIDASQLARALFVQMDAETGATVALPVSFEGGKYTMAWASWRFVQNPPLPAGVILPGTDSLFWQTSIASTPQGDVSNVGYFVNPSRQLVRFFAAPNIDSRFPSLGPADGYGLDEMVPARPDRTNDANWLEWLNPSGDKETFEPQINNQPSKVAAVLGGGIAGLWFRCLDVQGKPIAVDAVAQAGSGIRFDSSFKATVRRVPNAVECTIAIFEPTVLTRFGTRINASFPIQQPVGSSNSDAELLASVDAMMDSCVQAGIPSPKVFRASFDIPQGTYRP